MASVRRRVSSGFGSAPRSVPGRGGSARPAGPSHASSFSVISRLGTTPAGRSAPGTDAANSIAWQRLVERGIVSNVSECSVRQNMADWAGILFSREKIMFVQALFRGGLGRREQTFLARGVIYVYECVCEFTAHRQSSRLPVPPRLGSTRVFFTAA